MFYCSKAGTKDEHAQFVAEDPKRFEVMLFINYRMKVQLKANGWLWYETVPPSGIVWEA